MRILLVTSRFPLPPWRGNQVRSCQWLEALTENHVELLCPAPPNPHSLDELGYHAEVFETSTAARGLGVLGSMLGSRPLQEGLYATASARRALRRALDRGPWDLAIIQMVRSAWAVDHLEAAGIPLLFDAIDAMGLHFANSSPDFPLMLRPLVRLEARRCRRREAWLVDRTRLTTAVSARDLAALDAKDGRVVPVWAPETTAQRTIPEQPTVLLSGNLGYRPTVNAVLHFADHVWPRVKAEVPEARWVLAGARPHRAVRALARFDDVEVHSDVPDMTPFLAEASVAVAPMTTGSGVPMKVLEAWAAGAPVVAHPTAVAGLEGEVESSVAVATDPDGWAEHVVRLLTDRAAADHLAEQGRSAWATTYSPEKVKLDIIEAVQSVPDPRTWHSP